MKMKKLEKKDRTYLLCGDLQPLSLFIASRDSQRKRLLYFDEENQTNRALRYARNQKSVFMDEQDENVILEPIIFQDGVLSVLKSNPVLQEFLSYHPGNVTNGGAQFYEYDAEKSASDSVERLFNEVDALIAARELDLNTMLAVGRVYLNGDVDKMSSAELKRDILVFAKNYPNDFLDAINDPDLSVSNIASRAINEGYVTFRAGKDLYYNLKDNKKKILTVPFGTEASDALMTWLHSDDGVKLYEYLQSEFGEI
jgi:hypothetical protein